MKPRLWAGMACDQGLGSALSSLPAYTVLRALEDVVGPRLPHVPLRKAGVAET